MHVDLQAAGSCEEQASVNSVHDVACMWKPQPQACTLLDVHAVHQLITYTQSPEVLHIDGGAHRHASHGLSLHCPATAHSPSSNSMQRPQYQFCAAYASLLTADAECRAPWKLCWPTTKQMAPSLVDKNISEGSTVTTDKLLSLAKNVLPDARLSSYPKMSPITQLRTRAGKP